MRRLGTEPDCNEVFFPGSHQAIYHGTEFLTPLAAAGKYDRPWAAHDPVLGRYCPAIVAAPAVIVHFQAEPGSCVEVGLKRQRLLLLAPPAESPFHGSGTRKQVNDDPGSFEQMGGEPKFSE